MLQWCICFIELVFYLISNQRLKYKRKRQKELNDVHLRATNKQQASEQNWNLNFHISVGVRYRVRHVLFNGTEWVLLCEWIFEFKIGVLSVELILISTSSDAKRVFFRVEWGFERVEWRLFLVRDLDLIFTVLFEKPVATDCSYRCI